MEKDEWLEREEAKREKTPSLHIHSTIPILWRHLAPRALGAKKLSPDGQAFLGICHCMYERMDELATQGTTEKWSSAAV